MTAARIRTGLALISGVLFAVLLWISSQCLSPGGLDLFDGRPWGYTLSEARDYLSLLGEQERATYLGPVRWLDTLFPVVFALFLAMMLFEVTRGWSFVAQMLLMLLPGAYLVMDLAENALVGQMLRLPLAKLDGPLVSLASRFTVMKYGTLIATVVMLVGIGLGNLIWRRSR